MGLTSPSATANATLGPRETPESDSTAVPSVVVEMQPLAGSAYESVDVREDGLPNGIGNTNGSVGERAVKVEDVEPSAKGGRKNPAVEAWKFLKGIPKLTWLKCTKATLAITLCALAVLIKPIADLLGPVPYLVPVSCIFFFPVKTFGAMLESVLISLVGLGFGTLYSFTATCSIVAFNTRHPGNPSIASLICVIWLMAGLMVLGWLRARYVKVNVAIINSGMMMIFPLTQQTIETSYSIAGQWSILKPLLAGCVICWVVNVAFFPTFGGQDLHDSVRQSLLNLNEFIEILTETFLTSHTSPDTLSCLPKKAEAMRTSITKTTAALYESRYEVTFDRFSPGDYERIIDPLEAVMKYLSGMERAIRLKEALFSVDNEQSTKTAGSAVSGGWRKSWEADGGRDRERERERERFHPFRPPRAESLGQAAKVTITLDEASPVEPVNELDSRSLSPLQPSNASAHTTTTSVSDAPLPSSTELMDIIARGHQVHVHGRELVGGMFGGSQELFLLFVDSMSSTVRCLKDASKACLTDVTTDVLDGHWKAMLKKTLSRKGSLAGGGKGDSAESMQSVGGSTEGLTGGHGGHGHGNSHMGPLCKAMQRFDKRQWDVVEDMILKGRAAMAEHNNHPSAEPTPPPDTTPDPDSPTSSSTTAHHSSHPEPPLSTGGGMELILREEFLVCFFFAFNLRECAKEIKKIVEAAEACSVNRGTERMHRFWLPRMPVWKWLEGGGEVTLANEVEGEGREAAFPYVDGKQTDPPTRGAKLRNWVWKFVRFMQTYETKFALKMALAILLVTWPAYAFPAWFSELRGQWAIITVLVVMNPSVGGSNQFALYRCIGTVAGAVWGWITWLMAPGNPYVICLMLIIWAYPWWYVYLHTPHARIGTTAMLTYLVVVMLAYVQGSALGQSITEFAWKRCATMLVGVIVAVLISAYIWPFIARVQLRLSISRSLFQMGDMYSRLAYLVSNPPTKLSCEDDIAHLRMLEKRVRKRAAAHKTLLGLTRNEPRLKGSFREEVYGEILKGEVNLVERLGTLRKILQEGVFNEEGGEGGEGGFVMKILVKPVEMYRRDMFVAILLYFHVLAGSLNAKTPLPTFLPAARAARLRLLAKLREMSRKDEVEGKKRDDHVRYLYFFAYALATEDIIEELESVADRVRLLFGQLRFGP
ncbi:hypothetical protein HDV00_008052 [Rhizophlyctis rosea]|nr:hypothetical protein HDV00_008052 [Rhizophlyctis rosea]